jgi:hypothetical protein
MAVKPIFKESFFGTFIPPSSDSEDKSPKSTITPVWISNWTVTSNGIDRTYRVILYDGKKKSQNPRLSTTFIQISASTTPGSYPIKIGTRAININSNNFTALEENYNVIPTTDTNISAKWKEVAEKYLQKKVSIDLLPTKKDEDIMVDSFVALPPATASSAFQPSLSASIASTSIIENSSIASLPSTPASLPSPSPHLSLFRLLGFGTNTEPLSSKAALPSASLPASPSLPAKPPICPTSAPAIVSSKSPSVSAIVSSKSPSASALAPSQSSNASTAASALAPSQSSNASTAASPSSVAPGSKPAALVTSEPWSLLRLCGSLSRTPPVSIAPSPSSAVPKSQLPVQPSPLAACDKASSKPATSPAPAPFSNSRFSQISFSNKSFAILTMVSAVAFGVFLGMRNA